MELLLRREVMRWTYISSEVYDLFGQRLRTPYNPDRAMKTLAESCNLPCFVLVRPNLIPGYTELAGVVIRMNHNTISDNKIDLTHNLQ